MSKVIRVTPRTVGELGMWAEGMTGFKGWLGQMGNPGDGYIYSSNRPGSMKKWRGERASHMCASYLLGVIAATTAGIEAAGRPDHFIAQMTRAVQVNEVEYGQGKKDAIRAIESARVTGEREARVAA